MYDQSATADVPWQLRFLFADTHRAFWLIPSDNPIDYRAHRALHEFILPYQVLQTIFMEQMLAPASRNYVRWRIVAYFLFEIVMKLVFELADTASLMRGFDFLEEELEGGEVSVACDL